jgi:hypothetical protein
MKISNVPFPPTYALPASYPLQLRKETGKQKSGFLLLKYNKIFLLDNIKTSKGEPVLFSTKCCSVDLDHLLDIY